MKEKIYLKHHLGLGDHLICNGMVRQYAVEHKQVNLFCKPKYLKSVSYMYADLQNVCCVPADDAEAYTIMNECNIKCVTIGANSDSGNNFEESFYSHADMPAYYRWDKFKLYRDENTENLCASRANIDLSKPYIFLHDDPARQQDIRRDLLPHMPVYSLCEHTTENIFEHVKIIENAAEVHVIESCAMYISEYSYMNTMQKLHIHRYAKPMSIWGMPKLRKLWRYHI